MDSQEEVRRAALSAGVPVVRPQELELGRRVGAGSYGNVFAGVWRGTDVAVKMLKASLGAQDLRDAHEDVIKELRTMRRVARPSRSSVATQSRTRTAVVVCCGVRRILLSMNHRRALLWSTQALIA